MTIYGISHWRYNSGNIIFDSFKTLYNNLSLLECGYTEENIDTASPGDMDEYYSKEEQEKYGVVGIKVTLL